MDKKWEPSWHVFLGKSFGCHAVHEKNRFVYFTFEHNKISFLIYKASWSPSPKTWIRSCQLKLINFTVRFLKSEHKYIMKITASNLCAYHVSKEKCDKDFFYYFQLTCVKLILKINSFYFNSFVFFKFWGTFKYRLLAFVHRFLAFKFKIQIFFQ